jgi:hypothetical protein
MYVCMFRRHIVTCLTGQLVLMCRDSDAFISFECTASPEWSYAIAAFNLAMKVST